MDEVDVQMEAEVHPTEDVNKVKRAIENVFGAVEFELKPSDGKDILVARAKGTSGLMRFQSLLRQERILDAARAVLMEGLSKGSVTFFLNKQVAYVERVSFSKPAAESPLGPIKVLVKCERPRELIDWIAPKTA